MSGPVPRRARVLAGMCGQRVAAHHDAHATSSNPMRCSWHPTQSGGSCRGCSPHNSRSTILSSVRFVPRCPSSQRIDVSRPGDFILTILGTRSMSAVVVQELSKVGLSRASSENNQSICHNADCNGTIIF